MDYNKVDDKLSEISKKINIISAIKPLNLNTEKRKFLSAKSYEPQFTYVKPSLNKSMIQKELNSMSFDYSVIGNILRSKRDELVKSINLISSIGKKDLTEKSMELYPLPIKSEINMAKRDLRAEFKPEGKNMLDSDKLKDIFEYRLKQYGLNWQVKIKEIMSDFVSVSKGNVLFLRKNSLFSKFRALTSIRHEIDCHVLKAENGKHQPYKIFNRGFPDYLKTEEGLAIYMVNQLGLKIPKIFVPQLRVIGLNIALESSFSDIFDAAIDHGFDKTYAWQLASRLKRGLTYTSEPGAFTKDGIYFPGMLMIKKWLEKDKNNMNRLFVGKISLEYIEKISSIKGLKEAKYLPLQLDNKFIDGFI